MKIYCVLFLGVFSNPSKRDAEEIECPARCWEKVYNSDTSAYECVPEATKVSFLGNCAPNTTTKMSPKENPKFAQKTSQKFSKKYHKMCAKTIIKFARKKSQNLPIKKCQNLRNFFTKKCQKFWPKKPKTSERKIR